MNLPNFQSPISEVVKQMDNTTWFIHAQLFDDLLIVANPVTAAFVLKTTDGLILIDAIFPKEEMYRAIVNAIRDIGWDPGQIKKFLITHGHLDHCGCGRWVVENHHPETYLSKIDDEFWRDCPAFPDRKDTLKDFDIDHYVADGDEIVLGDTVIRVLFTPGHTPGGLSYIFPVHDNGVRHMAGMWGGTNPPGNLKGIVEYFYSLEHFQEEAAKYHCDVTLNNHPSFDGYSKIEYAKNRASHMPNVYVIGEENFQRFCKVFRILCYDKLTELAAK